MKELVKVAVPENSVVTVSQKEIDGKTVIVTEIEPRLEFKRGDLVIGTYGVNSEYHFIGRYEDHTPGRPYPHRIEGVLCKNAVKFQSLEQYEKIRRGEE